MSEDLYICTKATDRLEVAELLIKLSTNIFYSARYDKELELTEEEKDNLIKVADDPIDKLARKVEELATPIGTLILVPAASDFKNYLYCNGRKIDAKKYPELHSILPNSKLPTQKELIQYWKKGSKYNYFVRAK